MSALVDFYKKAQADPSIRADIEAARKGLGSKPSEEEVYSAAISIARKHGITLSQADFKLRPGSLDAEELKEVAGGGGGWCPGPLLMYYIPDLDPNYPGNK